MDIKDNYLTYSQYQYLWNLVKTTKYKYEGKDNVVISELDDTAFTFFPTQINGQKLFRNQINCFLPGLPTQFHIDHESKDAITLIYYLNPTYELDEGGCTELLIDGEIAGIRPITNRALIFNSTILHRGVTYKSQTRFTIGLLYAN